MMHHSDKGSPHSHGTPVDVVPTTAGIPSTLNPLPRYYGEFQSYSRGNTADTAVIPRKYRYRDTPYCTVCPSHAGIVSKRLNLS